VVKCERNRDRVFKIRRVSIPGKNNNAERGGVVNSNNNPYSEQQGFSTQDIVWAISVWSVIIFLSPVVVFYLLMVN
jgi:hypothetical protein